MMERIWAFSALMAALAAIFLLPGCAFDAQPGSGKPVIAVTSFPLYDFTASIAGDDFEVWLMLPPGQNAHTYEPTPQQMARLSSAGAFVYTGQYFEHWAKKVSESFKGDGPLAIEAGRSVLLLEPDDESLGPVDPHVWLSPKNARLMVWEIRDRLAEKYPKNKHALDVRAAEYVGRLDELDAKYESVTAQCRHREMIVSHAAFGYLSRHYGLVQIPIIKNFDPQGEVSISELAGVIDAAKKANATHVFFEDFISPKLSESVAAEINGSVALFSPMEAYSSEQLRMGGYIEVMERNLDRIKEALDCG